MNAPTAIVLIGPIGAGKTSVAKRLAEKIGSPHIELDDLRWEYYKEIGYDGEEAKRRFDEGGFWSMYEYWKPFEAHAAERVVAEHAEDVISFGAGHSVYEDDALFERVQRALQAFPSVILLLPSADMDESIRILAERGGPGPEMQPNINEHFLQHHSNRDLARYTVYTSGKSVEETCDEIIERVMRFRFHG